MGIEFDVNWNKSWKEHNSRRSQKEVQRIVEAVGEDDTLKGSAVGEALKGDKKIVVVKGIHHDKIGTHITVKVSFETYHIYLMKDYDPYDKGTFYWEPVLVCTGSQALQGDVKRLTYQNPKKVHYKDKNSTKYKRL